MFFGEGAVTQISPTGMLVSLATFTLVPLSIGMIFRFFFPQPAERAVEPVRKLVLYLMLVVLLLGIISSYEDLLAHFMTAGPLVIVMTLVTMGFGYGAAKVFNLPMPQVVTITFEVGVQNLALAFAITCILLRPDLAQNLALAFAITFNILQRPDLAVAALIYAVIMPAAALGFVAVARRLLAGEGEVAEV